jgi:glycerophosphoryl diester phosphodiesterase
VTRRRVPDWITTQPIAHRGLHDSATGIIENTEGAFARVAERGYAIELDVVQAADGEAIVFHDEDLQRLCARPERVRELTAGQLAQIAIQGTGDRIPTLAQVFTQIGGVVPILVEIKSSGTRPGPLELRVGELVRDYQGPVAVQSFNPRSLAWFAKHMPGVPRGQLAMRMTARDAPQLGAIQCFALSNLLLTHLSRPDFVAYDVASLANPAPRIARRLGLPLITWTVKSLGEWQRARPYADNLIFEGFAA